MSTHKELLVVGAPRSGTVFYSQILKRKGLKVEHERMGEDGCVSGFFYGNHNWYPYGHEKLEEKRGDFIFDQVDLIVRHPLPTISSIAELLKFDVCPAREFWSQFFDMTINPEGDTLKDAAVVWRNIYRYLLTHEHLENIIRLEDLIAKYNEPAPNRSMKDRYKKPITWEELGKIDEELALDILDYASMFNYVEEV